MRQIRTTLHANGRNGHASAKPQAGSVVLRPGTLHHITTALKKQWRRYRKELKRCQEDFSAEAVHDSRVETRRLLSLIGLLSPLLAVKHARKTQALLKDHLDTFDALRDTQVHLQAISKLVKRFSAAVAFCNYLRKKEKRLGRQTRKRIKCVKTKRLERLIAAARDGLKKWRKQYPPQAANALLLGVIHAAFARTQRLRDQISPEDTKTIHCTRIAFKKFRYMVEILAAHLKPVDKKLLNAMHRYQARMGDIQDAEVLLRSWKKFLKAAGTTSESSRAFETELRRCRQDLICDYMATADQLSEFWPVEAVSASRARPERRAMVRGRVGGRIRALRPASQGDSKKDIQ